MKIESKHFNILCLCAALVAFAFPPTLFPGFATGQGAIEAPQGDLNGDWVVGLPDLKIPTFFLDNNVVGLII